MVLAGDVLYSKYDPFCVYGYVKQIDGEVVMDGSFTQERVEKLLVPQPWTPIAGLFAVASGVCLAFSAASILSPARN